MFKDSQVIANEAASRNNFVLVVEVPWDRVSEAIDELSYLDVVAHISYLSR